MCLGKNPIFAAFITVAIVEIMTRKRDESTCDRSTHILTDCYLFVSSKRGFQEAP